jgi:hypothetical protein
MIGGVVGACVGVLVIIGIFLAIYFKRKIVLQTRKSFFERRSSIRVGDSLPTQIPKRVLVSCPTFDPHEFDIIDLGGKQASKKEKFVESMI